MERAVDARASAGNASRATPPLTFPCSTGRQLEVDPMIKGFKEFITRGNVVDLAVGVVIGASFAAVVNSFVDGIINPIVAAIFGKPDLSHVLTWTLNDAGTATTKDDAVLSIGLVLTALINFLLVALAIYFF